MIACASGSYWSSLTPSTSVMSGSVAGAEMITFFAPASRCFCADARSVKNPVDSITTSTPRSPHGRFAGSRSASPFSSLPSTTQRAARPTCTSPWNGPSDGVVTQQVRHRRHVAQVVEGDDLEVRATLERGAEEVAADPAESIDPYACFRHAGTLTVRSAAPDRYPLRSDDAVEHGARIPVDPHEAAVGRGDAARRARPTDEHERRMADRGCSARAAGKPVEIERLVRAPKRVERVRDPHLAARQLDLFCRDAVGEHRLAGPRRPRERAGPRLRRTASRCAATRDATRTRAARGAPAREAARRGRSGPRGARTASSRGRARRPRRRRRGSGSPAAGRGPARRTPPRPQRPGRRRGRARHRGARARAGSPPRAPARSASPSCRRSRTAATPGTARAGAPRRARRASGSRPRRRRRPRARRRGAARAPPPACALAGSSGLL